MLGRCGPRPEVLPGDLAVLRGVVVDRQLSGADLGGCALSGVCSGAGAAGELDEFELERLVGELSAGLIGGHDAADETLSCADDALHLFRDRLDVIGRERGVDAEVVIEAVGDRRADAEVRLRVDALHGLGEDVGGGVAQDRQAILAVDRDRQDVIGLGHGGREILEFAVHAHGDDGSVREQGEAVAGGGVRLVDFRHRSLHLGRLLGYSPDGGRLCVPDGAGAPSASVTYRGEAEIDLFWSEALKCQLLVKTLP